ncbi:MAG: hypothetical protein MJY70_01115 [Bacteroidales bacterium]|nr:hypothetical protein [Bacteroidales bacterium]
MQESHFLKFSGKNVEVIVHIVRCVDQCHDVFCEMSGQGWIVAFDGNSFFSGKSPFRSFRLEFHPVGFHLYDYLRISKTWAVSQTIGPDTCQEVDSVGPGRRFGMLHIQPELEDVIRVERLFYI